MTFNEAKPVWRPSTLLEAIYGSERGDVRFNRLTLPAVETTVRACSLREVLMLNSMKEER